MVNSKGIMTFLSDYDVNKLQRQYFKIYEVCERHKIVCSGMIGTLAYTFRKNTFTNLTNASYLMTALFYKTSMINNPVF